jgi:hypothetical protein
MPKPPPVPRPPARAAADAPAPAKSGTGLLVGLGVLGLVLLLAAGAAAFFFLRPAPDTAVAVVPPPPTAPPPTLAQGPPATVPPAVEPQQQPSVPAVTAASPGATVPRPTGGRTAPPGSSAATAANPEARPPTAAPPPQTQPARDTVADMLEREPPQVDGRDAGERAAEGYRGDRGSSGNSSFGTNRRFRPREKFPRDVTPAERRAVFVLLNVIHYQALHRQRTGKYGTFQQVLPRQVPDGGAFEHAGYRFDMTVEPDGFKIVATPQAMGLRGFVADDAGFVRYADE